jgi:hypothetical protein
VPIEVPFREGNVHMYIRLDEKIELMFTLIYETHFSLTPSFFILLFLSHGW